MVSTAIPNQVTLDQLVGEWELDAKTSEIRIKHKTVWGLVTVKGRYTSFAGRGSVSAGGQSAGSVTIDVASIDTRNKKRDDHLRSDEFFDARRFPSIVLEIAEATLRDGQAQIRSSLAIKEIRKPLDFTARIEAAATNTLTLTGTFEVDRERYGMSWNKGGMIKGLTTVSFRLALHRTQR